MISPPVENLVSALSDLRTMLAADGYALEVSALPGGGLVLAVVAGTDACADCLVPDTFLVAMAAHMLAEQGVRMLPEDIVVDQGKAGVT